MKLNTKLLAQPYRKAFGLAAAQLGLQDDPAGTVLQVQPLEHGLCVARTPDGWQIGCESLSAFLRALSLMRGSENRAPGFEYRETRQYRDLGMMLDCARGAVPDVKALKKLILTLALMGYTSVQLYLEDEFELEGYPYFGYLRGRYTMAELQEIDEFSVSVGIECVPCIQTLAHLSHALRWDAFEEMHDCDDILLCDEEKTYAWIEAMIDTMAKAFRSRRINIGMDEAHMLGLGRYLEKHGYQNRPEIMLRHLSRVMEILRRYGYRPMMWSDMFFRLANGGEYYASDEPVDPAVAAKVPPEMSLVYWDYYQDDGDVYRRMLRRHREFGCGIVFAGGAWKWTGFTPLNERSIFRSRLAAEACRENGVDEILVTSWGDNGAEASMFSVLPALAWWGEQCWAPQQDAAWLAARFAVCTGCSFDDIMLMDTPNYVPGNPAPGISDTSPAKTYLYQDILFGIADYQNPGEAEAQHFAQCAQKLSAAAKRNPALEPMLSAQAALCAALELKAPAGARLRSAFRADDREALRRMAGETLPELCRRLEAFLAAYHAQWYAENKPVGLETADLRIGGIIARVRTARERVQAYLDGRIETLPELQDELLPYSSKDAGRPIPFLKWNRLSSPSDL